MRTHSFLAVLLAGAFSLPAFAQAPAPIRLPDGTSIDALKDPKEAARVADILEKQYPAPRSEAVRMLLDILRGSQLDGSGGWFAPSQSRYGWDWLAQRAGLDPVVRTIPAAKLGELGDALDRDGDGQITKSDLDWSDRSPWMMQAGIMTRVFRRMETTGDGRVSKAEFDKVFADLAKDKDHFTADDFRRAMMPRGANGFSPGDAPNTPMLVRGLLGSELGSLMEGPRLDAPAPDLDLRSTDGKTRVQLSSLVGPKPVVLVFGNFTCGPFRSLYPDVEAAFRRWKDKANFVMVYVREAHPTDGWKMESNTRSGVSTAQPKTYDERVGVCEQFRKLIQPGMTLLVDGIDDPAGNAYSGMPARLYVIDRTGKVAYKSGRGPFGFKPGEMEQALVMSLMESPAPDSPDAVKPTALPTDEATWAKMPKAVVGSGAKLPNWAKAVAVSMPKTAAAMLELDYAQRTKSPLKPLLRGLMRMEIANANRCEYGRKTAWADLIDGGPVTLNSVPFPKEREFARLMTLSAGKVTDEMFADLRKTHGDKGVAAMVLLCAYGNFQDRILLGLNVPLEADGPMAPLEVKFAPGSLQAAPVLPEQKELPKLLVGGKNVVEKAPDWSAVTFEQLQSKLEAQRDRKPRLPVPDWETVKKGLPADFAANPTRILWVLICYGYVPELAVPWSQATRTMWSEAPQDRVFEESLFWVQTRAVQCNYCMGHCEMLLEVAGLAKKDVAERTRKLASDDWSAFPPAEQRAYAFARKLTSTPWELKPADYAVLQKDLGETQAMAVFWWLCRGLYMTRVSDGFQLNLERDNVFGDLAPKK